jgi:hypothetical protein
MRVAVSQSRINHVLIALGSLAEWGTYLTIANRLGFISRETFEEEMREADRLGHPEPRTPSADRIMESPRNGFPLEVESGTA